jgi:flavin-dependent dehydrogenase
MDRDYDAIVVGARCAGAATAMLLARRGHRVLMLDRARFPSEIPHGHFVHRHGPVRLASWGLLDRVVATGCPPVTELCSYVGDFRLRARGLSVDGIGLGYGPRRGQLDKVLVDAALEAGAELVEGVAVEGLLRDGDAVVGVRPAGRAPITARLTVGADGRRSLVARAVGAPTYEAAPTLACWYFSYFADVPERTFEMQVLPERRAVFAHPTNEGLYAVFVGWPIEEFGRVRADPAASLAAVLDAAPGLGERLRAGRRVERVYGSGDLPNFLRRPHGPGWALVGDAGCHKDPFLALGICDALRDAELLAEAADAGLTGRRPFELALAEYERRRDEATLPDYRENLRMASFGPTPPELLRLRAALRDRPDEARRFFLARAGRIAPEEFFGPESMARLLGAA